MRPRCMNCDERPARRGSLYCTNRCGCQYAEEINATTDTVWCPSKNAWEAIDETCNGCDAVLPDGAHPTAWDVRNARSSEAA